MSLLSMVWQPYNRDIITVKLLHVSWQTSEAVISFRASCHLVRCKSRDRVMFAPPERATSQKIFPSLPSFHRLIGCQLDISLSTLWHLADWVEMSRTGSGRWGWGRTRTVISPVITAVRRFPNGLFSNSRVRINCNGVTAVRSCGRNAFLSFCLLALTFQVKSHKGD